jgi:hypothetical protein
MSALNTTASSIPQTADTEVNKSGSAGGLSNAGKIGIAIGMAVLGVLSTAGILVFFSSRRRRRRDVEMRANMGDPTMISDKSQLPEVYRGDPIPFAFDYGVMPSNAQAVSPVSPINRQARTPLDSQRRGRPPSAVELEGGSVPAQELRSKHRSLYELPSPT